MVLMSESVSHKIPRGSLVLGLESDGQQMPCKPTLICLIDMRICEASAHLTCQLLLKSLIERQLDVIPVELLLNKPGGYCRLQQAWRMAA